MLGARATRRHHAAWVLRFVLLLHEPGKTAATKTLAFDGSSLPPARPVPAPPPRTVPRNIMIYITLRPMRRLPEFMGSHSHGAQLNTRQSRSGGIKKQRLD